MHDFEIKLGETLGIIQFMDVFNFPQSEVGVKLMGQLHPTIGKYQMTYDESFPWDVGDELGYQGNYDHYGLQLHTKRFKIMTITDRIETVDSVKIYFSSEDTVVIPWSPWPPPSSYSYIISYPNPLVYKKGERTLVNILLT